VTTGLLIYFAAPRFRVFREQQMTLEWWEAIISGLPLFVSLIVGMVQINSKGDSVIPVLWLGVAIVVGAFCVWTLRNRERGYEPSILADVTFTAPNIGTYIVLSIAFIMAGTIAYSGVADANSPTGVVAYFLIFAFGAAWLPLASLLIFWPAFKAATAPIDLSDDEEEGDEKDSGVTSDQDG
jgi:hypothetical protein